MLPCSEPTKNVPSPSLWHLTTLLNSSPGEKELGPLGPVDCVVKNIDRPLSILATVVSICFDRDSFTIQGYSKQFNHLNLVNFHIIHYEM